MIHVVVKPEDTKRRLPFYLAVEEWAAINLPANDYFFTWHVDPTVICGRNQDVELEVDLNYCREHGIQVYRRKSGGGCVYADHDNLMLSYITPSENVVTTFSEYTHMLTKLLRDFDLEVQEGGRNDILIGGRKVSGNAFYHIPGRSIVHGTILFSTNLPNMARALTPSRAKLESKKVTSVESRITTVHEHLPWVTFDTFRKFLEYVLADDEYIVTPQDLEKIQEIEQRYYSPQWLYGTHHGKHVNKYLPGIGTFNLDINTHNGIIEGINLTGDFFLVGDLDQLLKHFKGCHKDHDSLARAIDGLDASQCIMGLSNEKLIELISN